MTLIVENGSGVPDADSYVSPEDVRAYAAKYGKLWQPDCYDSAEAACRVGTMYIDNTYRYVFQGSRTNTDKQGLEWPRSGVYYANTSVPSDKLPQQLKNAVCEAAIREAAKPGVLFPDITPGANITSITADTVSIDYSGAGMMQGVKTFPIIGIIMAPLLQEVSPFNGSAGRG